MLARLVAKAKVDQLSPLPAALTMHRINEAEFFQQRLTDCTWSHPHRFPLSGGPVKISCRRPSLLPQPRSSLLMHLDSHSEPGKLQKPIFIFNKFESAAAPRLTGRKPCQPDRCRHVGITQTVRTWEGRAPQGQRTDAASL